MLLPCEIAVKCVLPTVRALLAKELMTTHSLKQETTAKLLGVSQPAISLYHRKLRGKALNLDNDPDVSRVIENLTTALAKNSLSHKDFILMFCEICKIVRAKGLLCELHKTFDPSIDIEKCELCMATNAMKCI